MTNQDDHLMGPANLPNKAGEHIMERPSHNSELRSEKTLETLTEERDFAESLIETVQAIILVLDTQGCIVRFNSYMEQLVGYTLDEVKGKDWFETFIKLENGNTVKSVFIKTVDDIQTSGTVNTISTKDGRTVLVEWSNKVLKDKKGRTVGVLAIGQDITERKQAVDQLKRQKKQLEKQKNQLEQRNRALSQFNYAVSHELKTPLVSIESSLGLIQSTLPPTTDPELATAFGYARHATQQMNNLLESLLLMFRIDSAGNDAETTEFRGLVQDAVDQLTTENKLKGITLTIAAEGPGLCGDRYKLSQIWLQLIENAAKYMGEQKHPAIDVGMEQTAQEVLFFVRDNGMGIEPASQGKIFGLFDQLDKTAAGTGLGLTLVQRIVDYYGGSIRVESAGTGQGSCFYFTLPDVLINEDMTT